MSRENASFHQLGVFVYSFQLVEREIEDIIVLLMNTDTEMVAILMSELDLSEKLKTVDVLLARFIDLRRGISEGYKAEFHKLVSRILKLCERRNDLVHSKYDTWQNIDGKLGLLRQNSKLRASKGLREELEEELLPEAFDGDVQSISDCLQELEKYRQRILGWHYDTDDADQRG
ncbi:hypothetical protein [Pseudohongiella spirulinae]|uniref:Cthe-2314-like HEPN domain-containing protein n=1 Tax=Pseudohongiella spirulinae TaxID=1249552 RepID=A0A0S2K989_9GAMM|nr:hypothetical protein [Pseudohongiella spirulinae]ALO44907.1 hypothetical protein PS2015_213 [Pseudohongiella spirulinae]